jgi:succinylglutamate desuccinylase
MLTVREHFPEGFLDVATRDLHALLPGPVLVHLPGRRPEPLFVSVLLHGNEDAGLKAVQMLLRRFAGEELPRALSVLVGNTRAAAEGFRRLDDQPDYNRVWPGAHTAGTPEHEMARQVVALMRERRVFASIDVHNNTGLNPHYACVNELGQPFLKLATLFSRIVVYFVRPLGVQSAAFAGLCPAVTVECGKPGTAAGEVHAERFLEAALRLESIPAQPVAAQDLDLYHTVGTVRVPDHIDFSFDGRDAALRFDPDLDHMNFRDLAPGTRLADVSSGLSLPLEVWDEQGRAVGGRYLVVTDGELRLRRAVTPAMLTLDSRIIRQDCLCYLMERLPCPPPTGPAGR